VSEKPEPEGPYRCMVTGVLCALKPLMFTFSHQSAPEKRFIGSSAAPVCSSCCSCAYTMLLSFDNSVGVRADNAPTKTTKKIDNPSILLVIEQYAIISIYV
jgi:hypothetical protein